MTRGNMHLGKVCPYADTCPVYHEEVEGMKRPTYLIKNVFCNRGIKGWRNCKRFNLLEENKKVTKTTTPYDAE
jgi:hypothetical protein